MKKDIMDYQIVQRDSDGFADIEFSGDFTDEYTENSKIFARVVNEYDNSIVLDRVYCDIHKDGWSVKLRVPEGGLYRVEALLVRDVNCEDNDWTPRIKFARHFGVGDVYLMAGQSNMTGYGRGIAYDPPCLGVHVFTNSGEWDIASNPLSDTLGSLYKPRECSTATSPALSFGKRLKDKIGVPVGLIPAAVGGSPLSAWNPEEDGCHYRDALDRLKTVGKIKGVLWYQGCTDCEEDKATTYFDRFKRMVELWREDLGDIPFITAQLNKSIGGNDKWWGVVREAQRRASFEIPGVSLVSTVDMGLSDGIHNSAASNVVIGERLAETAAKYVYGLNGHICPREVSAKYVDENHFDLEFDTEWVHWLGGNIGEIFDICTPDGVIHPVSYESRGKVLRFVTEEKITLPADISILWQSNPSMIVPKDVNWQPITSCYKMKIEG